MCERSARTIGKWVENFRFDAVLIETGNGAIAPSARLLRQQAIFDGAREEVRDFFERNLRLHLR
jgi:hypothetical protein